MDAQDWAGFILTLLSILAFIGVGARWVIKKYVEDYMSELKPNSGSSIKDQVTRLEDKVDKLFDMMIDHVKDHPRND
jgi:ribosome recycling factor